jgi:hypothetical protein
LARNAILDINHRIPACIDGFRGLIAGLIEALGGFKCDWAKGLNS